MRRERQIESDAYTIRSTGRFAFGGSGGGGTGESGLSVQGIRLNVPWNTLESGATQTVISITDVGIHTNDDGLDIVDNLVSLDEVSSTQITGWDDLELGEYGKTTINLECNAWNNNAWNVSYTFATDVNTTSWFVTDANADVYFKFDEQRALNSIYLAGEHFENNDGTTHNWFFEQVNFYNVNGDLLTPIEKPFCREDYMDYAESGGSDNSTYRYIFDGTARQSPVVTGIVIDMSGFTTGDIDVSDLAIAVNGSWTDIITTLTAAHEGSEITSLDDLSAGEYGTSSTGNNDDLWKGAAWDINIGPTFNTAHVFLQASSNKKIFVKFAEAVSLEFVALYFTDTVTNGDPSGDVVVYDEGGNELFITRTNLAGTTPIGDASGIAGTNAHLYAYGNQKLGVATPVRVTLPAVSGYAVDGETVTVTNTGAWQNSPTSYTYQWTENGSNIIGQTATSYEVDALTEGNTLTCKVTATNASGSTTVNVRTLEVKAANAVAPVVSGTRGVGNTLTCSTGTWNIPEDSFTYQWKRDGSNISGATSSSYVEVGADSGTTLSCDVTLLRSANSNGSFTVSSSNSLSDTLTYSSWAAIGNTYATTTNVRVQPLVNDSRVAVLDNNGLQAVTWNGTDFTRVGNINGTYTGGTKKTIGYKDEDELWFVDAAGISVLTFDGTDFAVDSGVTALTRSTVNSYPSISGMTPTTAAVIDNGNLFKIEVSGGVISIVGNVLAVGDIRDMVAGLADNLVVVQGTDTDTVKVYEFDGTDWAKISTTDYSMTTAISGVYEPTKLSSTQALVWDSATTVRAVIFNGVDTLTAQGTAGTATGTSSWPSSLGRYSSTLVVYSSWSGDLGMMEATTA